MMGTSLTKLFEELMMFKPDYFANSSVLNFELFQNELTFCLLVLLAIMGSLVVNCARYIVSKLDSLNTDEFFLKSLVQWRYRCSHCNRNLVVRDWFPLLENLINSVTCNKCVLKIERKQLFLDVGIALVSALTPLIFGWSLTSFTIIWVIWICVFISLIDLRFQIIPEFACWLLLFSGLLWSPFEPDPLLRIAGAAVSISLIWLSLAVVGFLKNEDTHAGGDVTFVAASGAWIGLENLPLFLIITSMLFGINGFVRLKLSGQNWTPMAPAISVGLVATLLTSLL